MTMYGANADELDRVAKAMIDAADDLENDTGFLSRLIQSVPWVGGVAKSFISMWESNHARRLQQSVQFLRLTAEGLTKNATQQREASNDNGGVGAGATPTPPRPNPMPADVAKLAADLKRVYGDVPPWLRPFALAMLLSRSIGSMGAERVALAVAALAMSGGAGQNIILAALSGTRILPPQAAAVVKDVVGSTKQLCLPPLQPRRGPGIVLSRIFRPSVIGVVRRWQRVLPISVPWIRPFVFDQCYPVDLSGVRVRYAG